MGADTEIVHNAFERMLWFAAISLESGEILFEEDHLLSQMLRSFQYRIARQAHERLGEAVLTAWVAETEKRKTNLIEQFELSMNLTIFSSAPLPPRRLFSTLETIQEVENTHQNLIRGLEDQLKLAPSEGHAWNTTSAFENAALFGLSRYKDVQEFEDLAETLRAAQDPIRARILGALAKSPSSSTLLVNRVWMSESDKPNPNWPRCLAVFSQLLSNFAVWNQPILVDALIRAITVITDEYLGQTARALEELDRLTDEYRRDSGLLRAARITVLSNLRRFHEMILVARDSIALWETELDHEQIHDVLSLRLASTAASELRDWKTAAEIFETAHAFAQKKRGYKALSLGLQADAAFANWNAGEVVRCIHGFSAVLKEVEKLAGNDTAKSEAFRLRKVIGVCFIWMLHKYEAKWDKIAYEPPPGACSKLDVTEELYRLPDSHPDALWWMLTQIDYYLDTKTGIEQHVSERLEQSPFPPVAPWFTKQRIQRSLRCGDVERIPEELSQFANACSQAHSRVSNLSYQVDPVPEINFQTAFLSDNSLFGLWLFAVALLRVAGSDELLQSTLTAWNQFCDTNSGFEKLTIWINSARQQQVLDASTSEQILFDSAADLWSQRIPAAIGLVRMENVSAVQLFMAQVAIVNFFNAVPWFDDIGSAVAALFASGWQRKLEFRGQFSMPNLTIPELRRACNFPDTDGLAKVSQIINAASRAANRPLDTALQKLVNQLASRRHA